MKCNSLTKSVIDSRKMSHIGTAKKAKGPFNSYVTLGGWVVLQVLRDAA